MKRRGANRLRDESLYWFIVDTVASAAGNGLSRQGQREIAERRLAQEYRIDLDQVRSNATLKSALSRIMALANPCNAKAAKELAEARKQGIHLHKCYAIAIGRLTLDEATNPKSTASNDGIQSATERGYRLGLNMCRYLDTPDLSGDFDTQLQLLNEIATGELTLRDPECLRDGSMPDTKANRAAFAKRIADDQEDAKRLLDNWFS